EVAKSEPVAQSRREASLTNPDLELIEHVLRNLPAVFDLVIFNVLGGEGCEGPGVFQNPFHLGEQPGLNDEVRRDAATTENRAAVVGFKFLLLIRMRSGGAELEAFFFKWFLDGTSAGGVIQRGRQRQACFFGEWVNTLHESFSEGWFADDSGAIVILHGAGHNLGRAC